MVENATGRSSGKLYISKNELKKKKKKKIIVAHVFTVQGITKSA